MTLSLLIFSTTSLWGAITCSPFTFESKNKKEASKVYKKCHNQTWKYITKNDVLVIATWETAGEKIDVSRIQGKSELSIKHYRKHKSPEFLVYTLPENIFGKCIEKGLLLDSKACR